jgi:hypothetical protein
MLTQQAQGSLFYTSRRGGETGVLEHCRSTNNGLDEHSEYYRGNVTAHPPRYPKHSRTEEIRISNLSDDDQRVFLEGQELYRETQTLEWSRANKAIENGSSRERMVIYVEDDFLPTTESDRLEERRKREREEMSDMYLSSAFGDDQGHGMDHDVYSRRPSIISTNHKKDKKDKKDTQQVDKNHPPLSWNCSVTWSPGDKWGDF